MVFFLSHAFELWGSVFSMVSFYFVSNHNHKYHIRVTYTKPLLGYKMWSEWFIKTDAINKDIFVHVLFDG